MPVLPVRVCTLTRVNLCDPCTSTCFARLEQEVMLRCGADNVLMTEDYDICQGYPDGSQGKVGGGADTRDLQDGAQGVTRLQHLCALLMIMPPCLFGIDHA